MDTQGNNQDNGDNNNQDTKQTEAPKHISPLDWHTYVRNFYRQYNSSDDYNDILITCVINGQLVPPTPGAWQDFLGHLDLVKRGHQAPPTYAPAYETWVANQSKPNFSQGASRALSVSSSTTTGSGRGGSGGSGGGGSDPATTLAALGASSGGGVGLASMGTSPALGLGSMGMGAATLGLGSMGMGVATSSHSSVQLKKADTTPSTLSRNSRQGSPPLDLEADNLIDRLSNKKRAKQNQDGQGKPKKTRQEFSAADFLLGSKAGQAAQEVLKDDTPPKKQPPKKQPPKDTPPKKQPPKEKLPPKDGEDGSGAEDQSGAGNAAAKKRDALARAAEARLQPPLASKGIPTPPISPPDQSRQPGVPTPQQASDQDDGNALDQALALLPNLSTEKGMEMVLAMMTTLVQQVKDMRQDLRTMQEVMGSKPAGDKDNQDKKDEGKESE